MTTIREPRLKPVVVTRLCPTQITVGMREVEAKRKRWREKDKDTAKGEEFLGKHMIPVVLGPKERHYIIDHHHLARALHDEGVKNIVVTIDLSKLEPDAFWFVPDNRNWMHAYDNRGRRMDYKDIPKSVSDLVTIHSARSQANCDAPEVSRRTRRRSVSFFGPIPFDGESSARRLKVISIMGSKALCNLPKARRQIFSPAGVARHQRIDSIIPSGVCRVRL